MIVCLVIKKDFSKYFSFGFIKAHRQTMKNEKKEQGRRTYNKRLFLCTNKKKNVQDNRNAY
jgi:hypothetical protein